VHRAHIVRGEGIAPYLTTLGIVHHHGDLGALGNEAVAGVVLRAQDPLKVHPLPRSVDAAVGVKERPVLALVGEGVETELPGADPLRPLAHDHRHGVVALPDDHQRRPRVLFGKGNGGNAVGVGGRLADGGALAAIDGNLHALHRLSIAQVGGPEERLGWRVLERQVGVGNH